MAQLKDLIVNGPSRFIGDVYATTFTGNLEGNASTATSATTAAALTGKTLVTASSVTTSNWSTYGNNHIPTMSFMAYWNGAYSGTNSNLTYCAQGTIIGSKNIGSQSVKYATTSGSCSGNAATATKATQDGNGNVIASTYLPLADKGLSNGKVPYYVNFPSYQQLVTLGYNEESTKTNDEAYLKGLCKWAIDNFAGQGQIILIGNAIPNSGGFCYIQLYSSNGKDATTGLPRYCSGTYISIDRATTNFGCINYIWTFGGRFYGNAASSSKWATARTITLTGSVTGSVSIDGSANVTLATTTNHTHSYLPLSGGTISSSVTTLVTLNSTGSESGIRFQLNNVSKGWAGYNATYGTHLFTYADGAGDGANHTLGIRCNGNGYIDSNTILHSGNYNSYAPSLTGTGASGTWGISISGNAATSNRTKFLETFQQNSTTNTYGERYPIWAQWSDTTNVRLKCTNYTVWTDKATTATNADNLAKVFIENINYAERTTGLKLIRYDDNWKANGFPEKWTSGLSVMAGYCGWQLVTYGGNSDTPYFRKVSDSGVWSNWRALAFTDSNVASATKLANSRTIWGQSFDGTGNVSGFPSFPPCININRNTQTGALLDSSKIGFEIETYANDARLKTYSASGGNPTHLVLTSNGNVGIGTNSPSYKLHVVGTAYASAGLVSDGPVKVNESFVVDGTNGGWYGKLNIADEVYILGEDTNINFIESLNIKQHNTTNNTETSIVSIDNSGNITLNVMNDNGGSYEISTRLGSLGIGIPSNDPNIAKTPSFLMSNRGYIYLNASLPSSPNYPLVVNGTIQCTTLSQTSDIKYKTNIKQIEYEEALKIIENLNPVTWDWNENTVETGSSSGFVAQEAEEFIPNAISRDNENNLSLDYTQLHSYEIRVIQEQQKEIIKLKEKLKILENLIS